MTVGERRPQQVRLATLLMTSPVVPVITIERAEDGVPLARALIAGGLTAIEITLRTPAAHDAAAAIVRDFPEVRVGIGTVLSAADLATAHKLGASFAVSPGATPDLLTAAAALDLPFLPGVATASETMAALARGFDVLKLFPAVPAGGIGAVRALAGPFPAVRFCPTGGIDQVNMVEWLKQPNVLAIGGSWLAPTADIRQGN